MVMPVPESMANQGVRVAAESQYGVLPGSPAWKRLNDVRIVPKPQYETDPFVPSGHEAPTVMVVNDEFTNLDVTGRLSYTSLMYVLSSLFGYPTSTLVNGSTYDHVWTWDGKTPIVPASYAIDYGTAANARRILGCVFNGLTAGVSRGGLDFGSSGFGKAIDTTIVTPGGLTNEVQTLTITGAPTGGTMTFSFLGRSTPPQVYNVTASALQTALQALPTIGAGAVTVSGTGTTRTITFTGRLGGQDVPLVGVTHALTGGTTPSAAIAQTTAGGDAAQDVPAMPIFPLHFDIFADDTWAAAVAGTTKLLALYNYSLGVGERLDRTRPVNSQRTSDSIIIREEQDHTVGLRMGADVSADAFYTNVRAGLMKFVRAFAQGPQTGDAANRYEFEAITSLLLTGTDGYDTENGIHVMTWNGRIARDLTSGNAAMFRLRNRIATL